MAFDEERKHDQTVLYPIRIDDAVIDAKEPWAAKLRIQVGSETSGNGKTMTPTTRASTE